MKARRILVVILMVFTIFFLVSSHKIRQINRKSSNQSVSTDVANVNSGYKLVIWLKKNTLEDKDYNTFDTWAYVISLNNMVYLQQGYDFGKDIDNLKTELFNKFDKKKLIKLFYESYIIGDYSWLNDFVRKYYILKGKDLNKYLQSKKITFGIMPKGNYTVYVNNKKAVLKDGKYVVSLKFPYILNIRVDRKWCVSYIKKIIGNNKNAINLNIWQCIRFKSLNNLPAKIDYGPYSFYKSSILDITKVEISYLNSSSAKKLWYLNLPVLTRSDKLVAQSFDSYGMPIIKLYNNWKIVNKCFDLYITTTGSLFTRIKNSNIPENRYLNALDWERKWFPWWWNLDTRSMVWFPGQMQIYNKKKWILLARYCYKF